MVVEVPQNFEAKNIHPGCTFFSLKVRVKSFLKENEHMGDKYIR